MWIVQDEFVDAVDARLAETLGVSRQVVRGALARLVEDGLVEQHPWKGSYVRTFGPQDVIDLYNVRLALEPDHVSVKPDRS